MRVLVVEDDSLLGDAVRLALGAAGFAADLVGNAEKARFALQTESFDLVIVDIGLPRENGLRLLQGLRSRGKIIPVLMLTARDGLSDRITALDLGADDYMTKPFHVPELVARCRALIRRAHAVASTRLTIGELQIDMAHKGNMWDDLHVVGSHGLPRILQPGYNITNLRFGLNPAGGRWLAELYVTNVADENAIVYSNTYNFDLRQTTNEPRVIGLRLNYRFGRETNSQ